MGSLDQHVTMDLKLTIVTVQYETHPKHQFPEYVFHFSWKPVCKVTATHLVLISGVGGVLQHHLIALVKEGLVKKENWSLLPTQMPAVQIFVKAVYLKPLKILEKICLLSLVLFLNIRKLSHKIFR